MTATRARSVGAAAAAGVILGALALFTALAGSAALRAVAEHRTVAVGTGAADAVDHFPGAALLYLAAEQAAPARGSTGTAPLPAMPIPATALRLATQANAVARPFAMTGASAVTRGRALECLAAAIYYEAASESDAGQQAVAQVVLNRVRHPAFPNSVCGVVFQGSERASGCQFSFACDGAMMRPPSRAGWARAAHVAAMALAGRVHAPVGLATHYHTFAVTPAWNRSLVMTDAVGAHFFHRWKGFWGTAAAFQQRYAGTEPLPGPHPRALGPASMIALPTVLPGPLPLPPPPAAIVQPAHAESGTPVTATALPPESPILDRWKDTGKPLR